MRDLSKTGFVAFTLGMAGMVGGVEVRPESPGSALSLGDSGNATALPLALGRKGFNNLSDRTALQEFDPSRVTPEFLDHLRKVGVQDPEQLIRNVQQGIYDETSSEQKEYSKSKGTDPLSSNGEKIDTLRSLMERAETDPRVRQRIRRVLAENRQLERANRTMDPPPINDTVIEHFNKTGVSPAEASEMHAKALDRKQLRESTIPSPSSLPFVVGPTHECIVSNPSECLDITGTKVTAWAQPSSFAIPGYELRIDMDLQVTNRCPNTVKDVTFVVDANRDCPSGHVYAPWYGPSYELTYPANPTVIDVGATASTQNSTLVQCVHWAGGGPYDSAALPDSFNLDIWAQGSDTQLTARSQDKYVAAVGPIPDRCPQSPPPPSYQAPPSPEVPTTDTPSIVFVHGFRPGDGSIPTAVKGSGEGFNCYKNYWGDAMDFLLERGLGDLRTIKYYNGDTNCTNGKETRFSSDLHNDLYKTPCLDYPTEKAGNEGTNDESLYHLSCLFSQYLYHNFGQSNRDVILVAHSMGGIIVRETMYQMQEHAGQSPFPDTIGHVTKAITFNTPHGGVIPGGSLSCGGCTQVTELVAGSALMSELSKSGRNPQTSGGFTDWTVIGSECDPLVRAPSAIDMDASNAVVYPHDSNTCYNHAGALNDKIVDQDSDQYYCDTSDPDHSPCGTYHGSTPGWGRVNNGLHGLSELYYSVTGRFPTIPSGAERIGSSRRLWLLSTVATAWALLRRQS